MKTNIELIKEKAVVIIADVKGIKEQVDEASEWNSIGKVIGNISKLYNLMMDIILTVELVTTDAVDDLEDLKSSDKLDAAVQILDDAIKLPFWLEIVDGHVFKLAISLGVEALNRKFGNEWNLDVVREAIEKGMSLIKMVDAVLDPVVGD